MRARIFKAFLVAFCFTLLSLDLAIPINLTAVDIGRHIKNGELILQGVSQVLHTNFYSYTYPDYAFINHHWFFGLLSFWGEKAFGFLGLSIAYILILLMALFFFMRAGLLRGNFPLVICVSMLALPVLAERREIRPEGVSILFMGVYFYLLTQLSLGQVRRSLVFVILSIVQVIWVNTHIFFFMGPLLVALFLWEGSVRGCKVCVRWLLPLLILTLSVNLLNPSGLEGALTPLNIFKELGYRLAENQNIFFMMKRFPSQKEYSYYLLLVFLALLGMVWAGRTRGWRKNMPMMMLTVFILAAGIKAVRLMSPAAFFAIPLLSYFYAQAIGSWAHQAQKMARVILLGVAMAIGVAHAFMPRPALGLGLVPQVNGSAEFFKDNHLQGPIFSNYDIGGYLIYHLAGQEKVFVDNRQEAFPPEFFKDVYIPMQEDSKTWGLKDAQYGFNAIFFYRHDLTPWGQNFLVERIQDPRWAPVFVDAYTIIYLRRNVQNEALIKRFELPKSMFGVSKGG